MCKSRVLTLYYHRVNSLEHDSNLLCVSPKKFRQQMLCLKKNYQIVRFEEDWTTLDSDAVAVTFDDGYLDNMEYAVPVLEELQVPATVFVSTGTLNQNRELWWDELERLLLIGNDIPDSFRITDEEFDCEWSTGTWEYRRNCYQGLHYLMKNCITPARREKWMMHLWNWRRLDRGCRKENLTLSSKDIGKLMESKMISIGAHTVSHPSLANLDRELQEYEIRSSIEILSQITGNKITLFSYPFGSAGEDFNDETIEICRQCGILKAASTERKLWNFETNCYKIPRRIVRDWELTEFDSRIRSYWEEAL